jgi:hypothetical protein
MPDGARAHDEQGLGKTCRHHRVLVGPDQLAVGFEPWQLPRPGACRDEDVARLDLRKGLAVLARDRDSLLPQQPRGAVDHGDLVLPH